MVVKVSVICAQLLHPDATCGTGRMILKLIGDVRAELVTG